MNERIRELAEQAFQPINDISTEGVADRYTFEQAWFQMYNQKFAELIVKECIDQGKQVQSQTVSNGSEDYNNGRKMGIEVFMNQIKKHFRGEE